MAEIQSVKYQVCLEVREDLVQFEPDICRGFLCACGAPSNVSQTGLGYNGRFS